MRTGSSGWGRKAACCGTEGGHCRRWTREDGLPSGFIHRVLPAREGGVWAATLRGLVRLREGRIEPARFGSLPGTPPAEAVTLDPRGRLWVVTREGLFVQEEGLQFRFRAPRPAGLNLTLAAGASGAIYLGTKAGITLFLPDGTRKEWGPAQGLPADGVAMVVEDGAGRIWAGSGRSLAVKPPDAARFTDQSARLGASLSPNSVPFKDADGSIWLPTQAGALHLSGDGTERLDAAGGLPFRWVRTVFRDREGTLWILGTALARLQGGGRVWNHALAAGTSGEVVWSITRTPGGELLAATDDGAVRVSSTAVTRIPGTAGHRIKNLALDRTGTLWMVSTIGPTLWLRPGHREAEPAPLGDFGIAVNSVMQDSRGQVWLSHVRYGILRWDPAARRLVQEVKGAGTGTLGAFRIREDAQGRLWAATTAGLYLKDANDPWRLFTEKQGLLPFGLYGMAFLPDGSAWVHYQEPQGLTRIRVDGDRLTVLEQRVKGQGLQSNQVYTVEVDAQGQSWATTDQGLDRLDPPLHIGQQDGMVSEDCAIQALLAETGRIWVGTAAGLVRVTRLREPRARSRQRRRTSSSSPMGAGSWSHPTEAWRPWRIGKPPWPSGWRHPPTWMSGRHASRCGSWALRMPGGRWMLPWCDTPRCPAVTIASRPVPRAGTVSSALWLASASAFSLPGGAPGGPWASEVLRSWASASSSCVYAWRPWPAARSSWRLS